MDASTMRWMSDEHLVSAARAELDPLTCTLLEIELLDRFETLAFAAGDIFTRLHNLTTETTKEPQ